MGAAEFAARLQRGNPCRLPPLVYGSSSGSSGSSEFCYFQSELPPALLDLASPPFVLPALEKGGSQHSSSSGSSSSSSSSHATPSPQLRQSQAARLWMGPQGSVSPAHFDLSHSFLTQVRGRCAG